MNINYTLSHAGKPMAEWSEINRNIPPAKKIVLIPPEILGRQEVRGFFKRSLVTSWTKSEAGYSVGLEAVKMP
ncbi:MAG TPA: hypothetical protein VFZ59_13235 [Verrucomicrobiae bacterium]|nr:hypothetical protein [Verrucomicrobiae bacterium]